VTCAVDSQEGKQARILDVSCGLIVNGGFGALRNENIIGCLQISVFARPIHSVDDLVGSQSITNLKSNDENDGNKEGEESRKNEPCQTCLSTT
jgi:hypothetical protein